MTQSLDDMLGAETAPAVGPTVADYRPVSFTVKRVVLEAMAAKAISVVPSREFMPVLKHFQVTVSPGGLCVSATDLELSVLASTSAVTADDTARVVLPAKKLVEIIKCAPEGDVRVSVDGEFAVIGSGSASWTLRLVDGSSYPPLPNLASIDFHTVSRESFVTALKRVRHALGRDTYRSQLMQMVINAGNGTPAQVLACDGVRLAITELAEFPVSLRIPSGAVDVLIKMLDADGAESIEVGETPSVVAFRVGAHVFAASKTMAEFPDVQKLVVAPALENRELLTVDKAALGEAVRRVRIAADDATSALALRLAPDQVTVIARDKHGNKSEEVVPATWEGDATLVVVNHRFLIDALDAYPSPTCLMWPGAGGKRKAMMRLSDEGSASTFILTQMIATAVGYED